MTERTAGNKASTRIDRRQLRQGMEVISGEGRSLGTIERLRPTP